MGEAHNTHIGSRAFGPWRVDPDGRQDRRSGEVKTYKLTPEELAKYQGVEPYKRPAVILEPKRKNEEDEVMAKLTKDQVFAEFKRHGYSKETIKMIAEKYGVTVKDVYCRVNHYRLKELLGIEKTEEPVPNLETVIDGVGKDVDVVVNDKGGSQSRLDYRFDLIDSKAIFSLAKVLAEGEVKYGKDNWRKIEPGSHINHAISHLYAHLAGDKQDEHLNHAFTRLMMALATED